MTKREQLSAVVIVEGHRDTQNLQRYFDVQTIETGGSALDAATQAYIRQAAQHHDMIVLTDPDYNGERLRRRLRAVVPTAQQAHITRAEGRAARDNPHRSLGVEHAAYATLVAALQQRRQPVAQQQTTSDVSAQWLRQQGLLAGADARTRRQWVSDHFRLGQTNGKQLLKRLQTCNITTTAITAVLAAFEREE